MTRQSSKLGLRMTHLCQNLWYYKQNTKSLRQKSKRQPYLHIQKIKVHRLFMAMHLDVQFQ